MNANNPSNAVVPPAPPAKPGLMEYGFWCFLLLAIGRVGELIPGLSGLPLAKIVIAFGILGLVTSWNRLPGLAPGAAPVAKCAIWLTVLSVILTPLSIWRGASREFMLQIFPTLAATTVIGYMMCRSWRCLRTTLLVLVVAALLLAYVALATYHGDRAATATMYDTNDLAYVLVTAFPITIGFALNAQTKFKKLLYFAIAGTLVSCILLTQSRGGFMGLVAAAILLLLLPLQPPQASGAATVKRKRRLPMLIFGVCIAGLVWTQLPEATRSRLATVLDLGHDYNLDPTNDRSRGQIWSRGIRAAIARPVGYGPYAYGMVDLRFGGRMQAPHNSFLQTLVELGVAGLILFLRMYWLTWRNLGRLRQQQLLQRVLPPQRREQIVFARVMQCSLVGNAVAGSFLSMAWATVLWLLFALSMALVALVERESREAA